tara:strand:- start:128 stop:346 length:219 start_codon:yes stop_codon:yes gene_type:complete
LHFAAFFATDPSSLSVIAAVAAVLSLVAEVEALGRSASAVASTYLVAQMDFEDSTKNPCLQETSALRKAASL